MPRFVSALASEAVVASVVPTALWLLLLKPIASRWNGGVSSPRAWWVPSCVVLSGGLTHAVLIAYSTKPWFFEASTIMNPAYLEPAGTAWLIWLPFALLALSTTLHLRTLDEPWLFIPFAVALLFAFWFIPYRFLALAGHWVIGTDLWYWLVTLLPLLVACGLMSARRARGVVRIALLTTLLAVAEPVAFVASSPVTLGSTLYRDLLSPGPDLATASELGINTDRPDGAARIAHRELYGLFQTVDVAAWGGCFRILTIRTPSGWKNVHAACFCE